MLDPNYQKRAQSQPAKNPSSAHIGHSGLASADMGHRDSFALPSQNPLTSEIAFGNFMLRSSSCGGVPRSRASADMGHSMGPRDLEEMEKKKGLLPQE